MPGRTTRAGCINDAGCRESLVDVELVDFAVRSYCHGSFGLDSGHRLTGATHTQFDVCLCHWVRQGLKDNLMLIFTAIVTFLLLIYLLTALLRPEWF